MDCRCVYLYSSYRHPYYSLTCRCVDSSTQNPIDLFMRQSANLQTCLLGGSRKFSKGWCRPKSVDFPVQKVGWNSPKKTKKKQPTSFCLKCSTKGSANSVPPPPPPPPPRFALQSFLVDVVHVYVRYHYCNLSNTY